MTPSPGTTSSRPLPAAGRGLASTGPGAARSAAKLGNPLHETIAAGRMPVILELHLTEADRAAYLSLRQRHIAHGYELPNLTVLGQYLRQMDVTSRELAPDERSLVRKLQVYADLVSSGGVDLLALDDGSRGRDTLDNAVAAALLSGLGADPARLMANVVARNRQAEQIRLRLKHFADLGLRNALLLTGDLPLGSPRPARFPLDSVGMCALARRMHLEGELPDDFWIAAAGHPNADADPDGLRTLQKTLAGAKVIITQAIYSFEAFARWMQALQQLGVLDMVHILAEVIPITSAAQLRAIADVPGMRVPAELVAELDAVKGRWERAAQGGGQSAEWVTQRVRVEGTNITRRLLHQIRKVPGVSGFYLGCVKGFEAHLELLREAPLLPEPGHAMHRMVRVSGADRQRAFAELPALEAWIEKARRRGRARARRRRWMGAWTDRRWLQTLFQVAEWPKIPVFGCKKCDRCDLSPDALICPRGCAKQMSHGPCGAPRWVDGRMLCEDTSRECTWAAIRQRREHYGIGVAERLEIREAPSPAFFEGKGFSAFLPVFAGSKRGPHWSLAWKAPLVRLLRLFSRDFRLPSHGDPRSLLTLAESKIEFVLDTLADRPDADTEELLVKLLSLIGTPAACTLIESRLGAFGLPAEGTVGDLSLREQFQLAEALPRMRRRFDSLGGHVSVPSGSGQAEELLAVIPEGRRLRQGMRREMAGGLISHIAALGVDVTYAESMLDGKNVDDFLAALTIFKDELQVARGRLSIAPGGLSAYLHRVHYKHHFHAPIALHRFVGGTQAPPRASLHIDMRQYQSAARFRMHVRETFERLIRGEDESTHGLVMEPHRPGLRSVCWPFNLEFWKRLREFEQATGKSYDASIGGSTDHNLAYARASARALFEKVHDHQLEGEPLYVLEIGVASTHRARTFMGEFRRLCELTGRDRGNVTYLLADFSETLLQAGLADLASQGIRAEAVQIEAGAPHLALARYRGRVIHAHLCNVYDNLPGDQAFWRDGQWHCIESRAYLPPRVLEGLAGKHGFAAEDHAWLGESLRGLGSADTGDSNLTSADARVAAFLDRCRDRLIELGRPANAYIHFWMDLFAAIRLDERYVAVPDLDCLFPHGIPGIDRPGEVLQRHLTGTREIRVHLNQAALSGFAQLLPVLHEHGTLEVVDLFVQRLDEYHHAFKGPAKYDGSTVNWLNGPLFRAVGEQLGYTVRFQPFRPFDAKSVSVVMLAYPSNQNHRTA